MHGAGVRVVFEVLQEKVPAYVYGEDGREPPIRSLENASMREVARRTAAYKAPARAQPL